MEEDIPKSNGTKESDISSSHPKKYEFWEQFLRTDYLSHFGIDSNVTLYRSDYNDVTRNLFQRLQSQ